MARLTPTPSPPAPQGAIRPRVDEHGVPLCFQGCPSYRLSLSGDYCHVAGADETADTFDGTPCLPAVLTLAADNATLTREAAAHVDALRAFGDKVRVLQGQREELAAQLEAEINVATRIDSDHDAQVRRLIEQNDKLIQEGDRLRAEVHALRANHAAWRSAIEMEWTGSNSALNVFMARVANRVAEIQATANNPRTATAVGIDATKE